MSSAYELKEKVNDFEKNFTSKSISNVHYIIPQGDITKRGAEYFKEAIVEWLSLEQKLHVLDFKTVENINSNCFRYIIEYQKKLHESGRKMVAINISGALEAHLVSHGVKDAINMIKDLKSLKANASSKVAIDKMTNNISSSIEKNLKNIFDDKECLGNMNTAKKVSLDNKHFNAFDYIATLPFRSGKFSGDIRLVVTKKVLIIIYNQMLKKEIKKVDAKVLDYLKEFLNIFFGNMKSAISDELGAKINMGTPIVCNWFEIKDYVSMKAYHTSVIHSFEIGSGHANLNLNILEIKKTDEAD